MAPKLVIANNDGHGMFYIDSIGPDEKPAAGLTPQEPWNSVGAIESAIERYRGTTLDVLEWNVSLGTKVNFESDTFERYGTGGRTDFTEGRRGDRRVAELLAEFTAQGIDVLTLLANKARDVGIQLQAGIRMNADYGHVWMGDFMPKCYNDSFWWDNQHLRIRNRDGSIETHLSYAYPEMRERKLLLVRELLTRSVDGISLDFLRHPPFVGYDEPLVTSFRQQHGPDPREIDEQDPRWTAHKCGPTTEYLRGVRELAGDRTVSVRVDHRDYLARGLDVETWTRERLIDILIVAEHGHGGYAMDLRPFVAMGGGACKVLAGEEGYLSGHDPSPEDDRKLAAGEPVDLGHRVMTVAEYCGRALDWYAQGADGVHVFNDWYHYEVFEVLGDPDRCRAVVAEAGRE